MHIVYTFSSDENGDDTMRPICDDCGDEAYRMTSRGKTLCVECWDEMMDRIRGQSSRGQAAPDTSGDAATRAHRDRCTEYQIRQAAQQGVDLAAYRQQIGVGLYGY